MAGFRLEAWESQEAFDEFLTYLGPVMEELGIELAQPPTIMPIVDLVQQHRLKPARTRLQRGKALAPSDVHPAVPPTGSSTALRPKHVSHHPPNTRSAAGPGVRGDTVTAARSPLR